MTDLFRLDAEGQIQVLTAGLLALERDSRSPLHLEACMRAAHSLKGAARIAGVEVVVRVAHAMEECFVGAQRGILALYQQEIDILLRAVDFINRASNAPEAAHSPESVQQVDLDTLLGALETVLEAGKGQAPKPSSSSKLESPTAPPTEERESTERVLRVTADNLNRLLGLAGESMVESRWLKPFAALLLSLKRQHDATERALDGLRDSLAAQGNSRDEAALSEIRQRLSEGRELLAQRLLELELFDGRSTNLAHRLYEAALACRMRPFAAGVKHFPRMVRDLARTLGKHVRLDIIGETTQVDRDILEKLDAPLGHLLRNALDHGIESPEERRRAGKPDEGVIRLEARHSAGLLQISVTDDGAGVDLTCLRSSVIARGLTSAELGARLEDTELLEFLFLPGFTTKNSVSDISGRGVGLDAVQNRIKEVRGNVRIFTELGTGSRFQLQLPLTLSVVRTLLVEISGEPYAFPLAHIVKTLKLPRQNVRMLEGREHFDFNGSAVGLVNAHQILGGTAPALDGQELSVIILGDLASPYGLVTDRFLGERELVVQPLDPRLGKIKDIAAAALMEDGSPALIVDIEDMLRSVDKLVTTGNLNKVDRVGGDDVKGALKRILVAEDSLSVRELERKLLDHAGYEVEVAVDGMDAWNTIRTGDFDLIITDVDMPRLDGIELVRLIKQDPRLKSLPVLIVSYKDREQDRERGLDAGADYYITKGSFQDDTLLRAVIDLIGEA